MTLEPLDESVAPEAAGGLHTGTAAGRWVVAGAVLGSGVAFLDGSVVNAALPAIADDLDADLAGLQWVLNGYLLTLASLLVIGGSLGRFRAPEAVRDRPRRGTRRPITRSTSRAAPRSRSVSVVWSTC